MVFSVVSVVSVVDAFFSNRQSAFVNSGTIVNRSPTSP